MDLQATIRESGGVTILDLEGRITIGTGNDRLGVEVRRLIESGARKVLLNLSRVSMIDSSGISTLVRTFVTLGRAGGSLKLVGVQGRVRDVLGVTRLLNVIPSFDDEAAALASFR